MKLIKYVFILLLVLGCSKKNEILKNNTDDNSQGEDWYQVSTINSNTSIIEEPKSSQGNVSYLIQGKNRAIMFDTGSGENSGFNGTKVKYQIEKLTSLPVTLILSHFHFDHNQNIEEFDKVAFPDLPFLKLKIVNEEYLFSSKELFSGTYPEKVKVTEWLPVNIDIDLGERIIQLVNIPGHTNESVAIIDKTNKIAFLGDYLYNGDLFLFDKNDIDAYKSTIDYLILNLDSSYRLFGAHGVPEISYSKLKDLQNFLICIKNNTCQSTNQVAWGYNTLVYNYNGMKIRIFLIN